MTAIISAKGLRKSYGKKECLKSLDLEVHSGRILGLVGPNGSGKTNLLEALSFLAPGRGLRRATLADVARHGAGDEAPCGDQSVRECRDGVAGSFSHARAGAVM